MYMYTFSLLLSIIFLKKSDDISTFTQKHFQVKMNKKKLFGYKYTKIKSLESKIRHY